ncbi:MAG: hypothetical protein SPI12_04065 [Actinomycetaceae bacterium]|nr:hypothetical protein [Actinomycetaceae bacterium]MDY6083021.1 hypothetical protein [Actinomycetaceae bacterium]
MSALTVDEESSRFADYRRPELHYGGTGDSGESLHVLQNVYQDLPGGVHSAADTSGVADASRKLNVGRNVNAGRTVHQQQAYREQSEQPGSHRSVMQRVDSRVEPAGVLFTGRAPVPAARVREGTSSEAQHHVLSRPQRYSSPQRRAHPAQHSLGVQQAHAMFVVVLALFVVVAAVVVVEVTNALLPGLDALGVVGDVLSASVPVVSGGVLI